MNATTDIQLTGRDRAVLRAIAQGRCMVSSDSGNPLTIDGYCFADQFATLRLTSAGLITSAGPVPAPARLTPTGRELLIAA